jgi:CBS domain-containing protein
MLATDVMRTWFATVRPNAPLLDAIRLLLETDQRGLPVIDDNGSLVGVISEGDFLHRRELGVSCPAGFLLEWLLGKEKVSSHASACKPCGVDAVMTRNLVSVDETATVDEVVARMDDHQECTKHQLDFIRRDTKRLLKHSERVIDNTAKLVETWRQN